MVAFTRSSDELAGVLAHEMGHITAHHTAIATSQEFRKLLGVTHVKDRDDIRLPFRATFRGCNQQIRWLEYRGVPLIQMESLMMRGGLMRPAKRCA